MKRGKFITVEGVEGTGKTTQVDFIRSWLQKHGVEVLVTREPGGTPLGERIRGVLLDTANDSLSRETELLLMFAARADHWTNKINPTLASGVWVLSDRFADASYAYQGGGRGVSPQHIANLERLVLGEHRPDLTLLLDMPLDIAARRVANRGNKDRIELEQAAFFDRVRSTYLEIAQTQSERVRIVDAARSIPKVQAQIADYLSQFMGGSA